MDKPEFVWYVAYGSNMLKERYMCYIEGHRFRCFGREYGKCSDATPPKDKRSYELPHNMYYAKSSGRWEGKGVSFLDGTSPGKAYGVAYLITSGQFEDIQKAEGATWYDWILELSAVDGIPARTITNHRKLPLNEPSEKYLSVLAEGLKENYVYLRDEEIDEYLQSRNKYA
jgi:hypothetical protein